MYQSFNLDHRAISVRHSYWSWLSDLKSTIEIIQNRDYDLSFCINQYLLFGGLISLTFYFYVCDYDCRDCGKQVYLGKWIFYWLVLFWLNYLLEFGCYDVFVFKVFLICVLKIHVKELKNLNFIFLKTFFCILKTLNTQFLDGIIIYVIP